MAIIGCGLTCTYCKSALCLLLWVSVDILSTLTLKYGMQYIKCVCRCVCCAHSHTDTDKPPHTPNTHIYTHMQFYVLYAVLEGECRQDVRTATGCLHSPAGGDRGV